MSKDELAPEKRVRWFTSLYATHLLRINSLSGRLLPRAFFFLSFFFKHHKTRIHKCARVMPNAGGRMLASSELPAIRIQMIGRLHFYKGDSGGKRERKKSAPPSSPPSYAPLRIVSDIFRWPSTPRIYACLRKLPLVSVTRLQR